MQPPVNLHFQKHKKFNKELSNANPGKLNTSLIGKLVTPYSLKLLMRIIML